MTEHRVIVIPFDRLTIGTVYATTDADGYLPTSGDGMLKLPLPPDVTLLWQFVAHPIDKRKISFSWGLRDHRERHVRVSDDGRDRARSRSPRRSSPTSRSARNETGVPE